ncbi:hypothetical protein FPANT_13195 [Fusarium pseudoanthophilum]|uniref:Uncharacterized protein n=1 Tax=Fusarium pseudoanthophilum TaxID=48495 RepID=A0A8H5NPK7_9HYPO|nr:hypothetical protein FPANT_13195 [Fusarium pseudoanthophilum]
MVRHLFPEIRISSNTRLCLRTQTHDRSIMPTFDGIVPEFPDIRIDFTTEQCQPLTEYVWEPRHKNRSPMSTFDGIVSEFPDIRTELAAEQW